MSPLTTGLLALAASLAAAPLRAQPAASPSEGRPARVEVAGLGGVAGTSPEAGALVSLPLGDRLSIDAGAGYLARVFRSPAFLLTHVQLRIPFRGHLRSRYSLVVGATHLEPLDPREGDSPLWRQDVRRRLFPHAGASLQWPIGAHVDLRVDAQIVVQGSELIPLVPRVVGGIAWPGGRRRVP